MQNTKIRTLGPSLIDFSRWLDEGGPESLFNSVDRPILLIKLLSRCRFIFTPHTEVKLHGPIVIYRRHSVLWKLWKCYEF